MNSKLWIVVVALVLVGAACGGDDTATDASDDTGSDDEAATPADDGADDGDADSSGAPVDGDADSDWCQAVRSAADGEDGGIDVNLLGLTAEELEAQFTENVAIVERWESTAPPEIQSDVTTMADAFRTLVSLAEAAEWDLMVMGTDPAFIEAFETDELGAAADRIDAYSRDVCGVDLGVAAVDSLAGDGQTPSVPSGSSADDGDLVARFLEPFGLPPSFLSDDEQACVNEQLRQEFPDGMPDNLTITAEMGEMFERVASACDLAIT